MPPIDELKPATSREQSAMEALDRGISDVSGTGLDPDAQADLPAGYGQQDSDMTPGQIRLAQLAAYGWSTLGIILLPIAFALRCGRWSMRTLVCHHNGWEFGGF